jgi:hypothetical protein
MRDQAIRYPASADRLVTSYVGDGERRHCYFITRSRADLVRSLPSDSGSHPIQMSCSSLWC